MSNEIIKNQKFKKKKFNLSFNEIIFDLLITLCVVIFSIVITPKTFQNDTFYTIKCGEYIFNNGIFNLKSDPFSWLDLPYCFPHWLYDLMIYIIYAKFSWDGLYISTIIFTCILGLCLYNTSLYKSQNRLVSGIITFLTLYLMEPYIAARAQLVTFILFSLEILFIEKLLDTKKIRYGIFLIIIAALIAQLHVAVYPMFFIFTLPYCAEFILSFILDNFIFIIMDIKKEFLKQLLKNNKDENKAKEITEKITKIEQKIKIKELKKNRMKENPYKVKVQKNNAIALLIVVIIISGLVGFLNPTGDTAYTYLLKTYEGNTTNSINEHQPMVLIDSENFAVSLVIFIMLLTFMDLKIGFSDLCMLAGVIIMAFLSKRQIAIYAIAASPILSKLISDFFLKYDSKTTEKILKKVTSVIGLVIIISVSLFAGYKFYTKEAKKQYIYESDYPVDAANWILENLDVSRLRLYNEYNYGSYLIYKGIPVFIDSRADLYAPEFNSVEGYANAGQDIFSEALDIPSLGIGYEEIFEKYGVNYVMLYSNAKLALLLNEDENYNLLYDDDAFKIYERLNAKDGE